MPANIRPQGIAKVEEGLDQKLYQNNTAILADTLHFETLSFHDFAGAILNPRGIYEALTANHLDYYIWVAVKKVSDNWKKDGWAVAQKECLTRTLHQLILELANAISDRIPGPYFGLVDPRKHADMSYLVDNAHGMYGLLRDQGVPENDIIVSIPATEAGIYATQQLQKDGINVNLCYVTSLIHAAACVEARATAISISVGPLLEMYERRRKIVYPDPSKHPGIETLQSILAYFKLNSIRTKVIGTSFRTLAEIGLLSDCDAVCVSPEHAERLKWSRVPTTSLDDYDPQHPAIFRARQAKYPMNLLSSAKEGFSDWLSPESRNMTGELLREALQEMESQMDLIEQVVEVETKRRYELGTLKLKDIYRNSFRGKKQSAQPSKKGKVGLDMREAQDPGVEQAMDEVF